MSISARLRVVFCAFCLAFGAGVATAQTCVTWTNITPGQPTAPAGRSRHFAAWDSGRNVLIVFGGVDGNFTALGDTWEWNGTSWTLKSTTGPAPRFDGHMVYDSNRAVTVLFGGRDGGLNTLNDTWEWNGTTWTLRTPALKPSARDTFGMTYDSNRRRVQVWGGYDGTANTELWEYNGTNWQLRTSTGPAGRSWCSMAYDPVRSRTVLFGGTDGTSVFYGDTWEYNGTTNAWTQASPTSSPSVRGGAAVAYHPGKGIVLYGGTSSVFSAGFFDVWYYDGLTWSSQPASPPPVRWTGTMVYDTANFRTLLFGGQAFTNQFNDLWGWDSLFWLPVYNVTPAKRDAAQLSYDSARDRVVMFGGQVFGAGYQADTWEFDGSQWQFRTSTGPQARGFAVTAYDEVAQNTILFGGVDQQGVDLGDTWRWNGFTWTQLSPAASPSPRSNYSAMVYDSDRQVMVMFGGSQAGVRLGDTWEFDGNNWTLAATTGPAGRVGHAMAYDRARHQTVLFGGRTDVARQGDTWTWDGAAWSLAASTGPSPRTPTSMTYDIARQRVVLFGGIDLSNIGQNDTWTWDGAEWTEVGSGGPPGGRWIHGTTYDSLRNRVVIFGGITGDSLESYSDTWAGVISVPMTSNPGDQMLSAGQTAMFSVSASGSGVLHYQWRKDGVDLVDGGNVSGATSPTLSVSNVQASDAGDYDVVVADACGQQVRSAAASLTIGGCPNNQPACDHSDIFPTGAPDCVVNLSDLGVVLSNFAPGVPGKTRDQGDIFPLAGGDGFVNLSDLGQILSDFNTDCR